MLNYNGTIYQNIEDLETAMSSDGLSEEQKQFLRNDFNGVPNPAPINSVPKFVTPRQIRLALIMSGISLDVIENTINSLSEPQKSIVRVTWEYSVEFQRNNPVLTSMAPVLGLTSEQVDQLFILANTL